MTTPRTRSIALVAVAVLVVLVTGGVSTAAWNRAGTGAGVVAADALRAPAVTATRSTTQPTSSIVVAWTAADQLPGTTYAVTRTAGGSTTTLAGCTASPCTDSGLASGTSHTYTVTASRHGWSRSGTATQSTQAVSNLTSFALSTTGDPQAGVSQSVTVTARDQNGATFTGYTGEKSLTWSGTATAASATGASATYGQATFANGVATVSVNLKRAGSGLTLTASDGSTTGTTTVTTTANSPARLGFTSVSSNGSPVTTCLLGCTLANRGGTGDITTKVSILDSFGNVTKATAQISVTVTKSGGTFTPATPSIVIAANESESTNSVKLADNGNWTSQTLTASAGGYSPDVKATISK